MKGQYMLIGFSPTIFCAIQTEEFCFMNLLKSLHLLSPDSTYLHNSESKLWEIKKHADLPTEF